MSRKALPTHFFVLVVVRLGRRILLVHERKHGQGWYLPAGRVEPGESLVEAAKRETREEAGIEIEIEGLLRIEHSASEQHTRVRVFFVARPIDDTAPKSVPDQETLGAAWVAPSELESYPLRGQEVAEIAEYIGGQHQVMPLSMLAHEGAPWA